MLICSTSPHILHVIRSLGHGSNTRPRPSVKRPVDNFVDSSDRARSRSADPKYMQVSFEIALGIGQISILQCAIHSTVATMNGLIHQAAIWRTSSSTQHLIVSNFDSTLIASFSNTAFT